MIKTQRWLMLTLLAGMMNTALPCLAQPFDLKFGPEFTFADQFQSEQVSTKRYVMWVKRHLLRNQIDEAKFNIKKTTHGGPTFISPNGWSFQVTKDPGVIEIKMAPLRLSDWKRFSADIQDAIFVSAYNTNFFPADFQGGGHISIDLSELKKAPAASAQFYCRLLEPQ